MLFNRRSARPTDIDLGEPTELVTSPPTDRLEMPTEVSPAPVGFLDAKTSPTHRPQRDTIEMTEQPTQVMRHDEVARNLSQNGPHVPVRPRLPGIPPMLTTPPLMATPMPPLPQSPKSARLARGSSSELDRAKLDRAKLEKAKLEQAKLEQAKQAKLEQAKLDQGKQPGTIKRAATAHTVARSTIEDTAPNPVVTESRPSTDVSMPKMLGGYRITRVLASGQMGVVYRGDHPTNRQPPVAIKAIHGQMQTNPAIVSRFFAESIVLARVVHPNVVRFRDFGYDAQGSAYLVMELLDGETLTSRLAREGRIDISVATDIAMQLAMGIAAAHEQGIVHRDIKPDNVFLCSDGRVKLLDFGIAKIEGQTASHTLQGDLLGTAAYMAPEQGRAASESDARSDLYSIGCILFEMVCGIVPFPGSLVETLVAHQTGQRPPARALNPEVSDQLDRLIDRLLARDPAARPQTAVDLIRVLGALESTTERPRAPRSGTFIDRKPFPTDPSTTERIARVSRAPVTLGILATLLVLAFSIFLLR
jgi:hypothetical protein